MSSRCLGAQYQCPALPIPRARHGAPTSKQPTPNPSVKGTSRKRAAPYVERWTAHASRPFLARLHIDLEVIMENGILREYQVIWWTDDPAFPREHLTVVASSLEDASKQVKDRFGTNIKTSIWSEDDAATPR